MRFAVKQILRRPKGALRSCLWLLGLSIVLRTVGAILNAMEVDWLVRPVEMGWLEGIMAMLLSAWLTMTGVKAHNDEPDVVGPPEVVATDNLNPVVQNR